MLTICVAGDEFWDEEAERFVTPNAFDLTLEHSLISLSKWESEFQKPFLSSTEKTNEEALAYIHHMIVGPECTRDDLQWLTEQNMTDISLYMSSQLTATWFSDNDPGPKNGEVITSELIYFWMTSFNIPFHPAETWHLSRLFTLIRVANLKNSKPKAMPKAEVYARNRKLNEQRRKAMGTKG